MTSIIITTINKIIKSVILLTLTLSALPVPATTQTEIRTQLNNTPWTTVSKSENVKYGKDKWNGTSDLSFKYKTGFYEDSFLIWCEITDNQVILKEGNTIVSDHVEIWLCDPAMLQESREKKEELNAAEEYIMPCEPEGVREEAHTLITENKKYYSTYPFPQQLIFNKNQITASFPPLRDAYTYAYEPTPTGYQFFAKIKPAGTLNLKTGTLPTLLYLIDISDIDGNETKQKSLISSSAQRLYNKPETFNSLKLTRPYETQWPPEIKVQIELFPEGHAALTPSGYEFRVPTVQTIDGECSMPVIISRYERLKWIFDFSCGSLNGHIYQKGMILSNGIQFKGVSFEENLSSTGGFEYELLSSKEKKGAIYFLIYAEGASNWSRPNGQCGAGIERDLIWIKTDPTLASITINSETIDSCWKPISQDETQPENEKFKLIRKGSLIINNFSDYSNDKKYTITYDTEKPESGLIKKINE